MSPRDPDERHLGDIPVRLYRFRARTRPRWAARIDLAELGTPEGYGATPDEALRSLAGKLTTGDLERLRLLTDPAEDIATADFGEILRELRHNVGVSQADLARAAGVHLRQIRRYEAGEQQPVLPIAVWLAQALGVTVDQLAGQPSQHGNSPAGGARF